ncbi:MAG: hypothetical protein LH614_22720 [Pyrinomonadaceae bacterium]|nr:hypothetical protein [Pyrinomonadaceae bacterium]
MTKKVISLTMSCLAIAVLVAVVAACGIFSSSKVPGTGGSTGGTGWKVWVKTSPCAGGRTDWVSVAQRNPTEGGGGSFWQTADLILSPMPCTLVSDDSCTFAAATASADTIRASGKFTGYCCRDYSVWKNTATGEKSIVKGSGSAGFGWMFEKGSLCCEEAEAITGKPGACSGSTTVAAPPLGPRPTNTNRAVSESNSGGYSSNNQIVTTTPTPARTPDAVSGRWTLVSVTAVPESKSGWTYNAQSSSAHYDIYNGDKHDFQWTKPPTQIDANGFTVSISVQCNSQRNNRNSALIGVSGDGLTSDTPAGERKAEAFAENGANGSGQKSVTFKPSPNANEIQVEIGLGWGDVRFVYKYRRAE